MSQRDGFSTGFFLGSLIGGLVGGALGVVLTNRQFNDNESEGLRRMKTRNNVSTSEDGDSRTMESARQSLENKIAELNGAIDEVRSSLSAVHLEPAELAGPEEHHNTP